MALSTEAIHRHQTLDAATTWPIDPAASRIEFTVRQHLPFARRLSLIGRTVVGRFAIVAGTIVMEERRPASAQVAVAIDAASLDTGLARRDAHARLVDLAHALRQPLVGPGAR